MATTTLDLNEIFKDTLSHQPTYYGILSPAHAALISPLLNIPHTKTTQTTRGLFPNSPIFDTKKTNTTQPPLIFSGPLSPIKSKDEPMSLGDYLDQNFPAAKSP